MDKLHNQASNGGGDRSGTQNPAREMAAWYARMTSDSVSDADRQAFEDWLRSDPRHAAMVGRLHSALSRADRLGESAFADSSAARPSGRAARFSGIALRWPIAFAATIVAAASVAVLGAYLLTPPYQDYASTIGERRDIRLSDGSRVQLNTNTHVRWRATADTRQIILVTGEAYFSVAPDKAKPFVIKAGDREIRAVGTEFDVAGLGTRTVVTVTEGTVEVSAPRGLLPFRLNQPGAARLSAGQETGYGADGALDPMRRVSVATAAPWRRGQLIYQSRPVEEVIADLARYFPGRIVVKESGPSNLTVSAVINLGDKDTTLATLANQLPVKIQKLDDNTTIVTIQR